MTWAFYSGDHVYIDVDELTHVIGSASPDACRWGTECRRYDDVAFRYDFKRGRVMRTTGPATCVKCMVEWAAMHEFRERRRRP